MIIISIPQIFYWLLYYSAYLGFNKIAKFEENFEIHSKTAKKTLQNAIKEAQQTIEKNLSSQSNTFNEKRAHLYLDKGNEKTKSQNRKKAAVVIQIHENFWLMGTFIAV